MSDNQIYSRSYRWSTRWDGRRRSMPVRVDDRWSYAGLPVVRIENAALVADIVPSLGGKVLHLVDKRADRNVLWRHPRITPHAGPLQANVDDQ
jgi:hypothetical protein